MGGPGCRVWWRAEGGAGHRHEAAAGDPGACHAVAGLPSPGAPVGPCTLAARPGPARFTAATGGSAARPGLIKKLCSGTPGPLPPRPVVGAAP